MATSWRVQLAADPRVGFFSFIGSARVGWSLRSQLAPGTRCALEHGGAAPVIVAADADLDQAVPALAKGGFYHAGQVCVSVQRVFAHASIALEFAAPARRACQHAEGRRPDLARDRGRAADPRQRGGACSRLGRGGGGGRRHAALRRHSRSRRPATRRPWSSSRRPTAACRARRCSGRSSAVYRYDDLDDACTRANALPWAFQAAVFTRDYATAMRAYRGLDASAVMLNDHTAFRVDWMPFAGPAPVRPRGRGHPLHLPRDADREALRGPDAMTAGYGERPAC